MICVSENLNFHRKDTLFQRIFGQNRLRKPCESVKFVKNTGFIQEYLYICSVGIRQMSH